MELKIPFAYRKKEVLIGVSVKKKARKVMKILINCELKP